jgi:SWI/SNF related-matrix-associated actin-dependent regulator of chromatin subfamily C
MMLISLSESVIDMLCSRPPSLQVLVVGLCRGKELVTVGLASTASSSAGLETIEEREFTRLVGAAVNLTLQKFELKLAQFAEMEEIVQAERRDLEKGWQQLFLDRLAFKKRAKDMETAFR